MVRQILSMLAMSSAFGVGAALANGRRLERVAAFHGAMPAGVTVARNGRIFVNFPQWGDDAPYAVAEVKGEKLVPYPSPELNRADPERPAETLLSVQSVVADARDRLWLLDTASPNFQKPLEGGAKLVAVDLTTDRVVRTLVLPASVMRETTYLNDMRFDLRQGEGVVYITDSAPGGPGAILVVDLASGRALRRLSGHASTEADPSFEPVIEGEPFKNRPRGGPETPVRVPVDGIALSADGAMLYYCPLSSRRLYGVPTALLRDPSVSDEQLGAHVVDLGEKGASDGLEVDDRGRIYAGDYEHNALRCWADGAWTTLIESPRLLWPDTLSIGSDGYLYVIANQLHRQPGFHDGNDLRKKPYELLRLKIDAGPVHLSSAPHAG